MPPIYDPAAERPAYLDELQAFDAFAELDLPEAPERLGEVLLGLLASPNICSRNWIWEQYDHQVMLNTVVLPGSDAAVIRIGDTGRGEMTDRAIAASSDCNGRYCYLDPYVGAQIAFAEAARNVACSGGVPAAITDCLNFGSPEKPEVFWTFRSRFAVWQTPAGPSVCRSSAATWLYNEASALRSIPRPRSAWSVCSTM